MTDMVDREKSGQKTGLSRRTFVAASAAGAVSPLISGRGAWAADSENVIRVGFVSPVTGNLGTFGVGDGYLTTQVAWYFGRGGKPGQPSPFKWTYHFAFGGAQFAGLYLSLWKQVPNNKKVGVMFPNDADGNAVRPLLTEAFKKEGYTVIDPGPFEDGTSDYAAQIALFKKERVDLFVALVLPPDFGAMWRQAAQQGFAKTTKVSTPTKSGTNPSEIEALGNLGYKLTTTSPWVPAAPYKSPILGVTSQQLADGYEAASGKQVTQQLGASNAVFDAGFQALQMSGNPLDKAALAKTLSNLKCETTVGLIDFNVGPMPHVIAVTPLFGTQWRKAPKGSKWKVVQVVAENAADPNYKVTDHLIPYDA
jgi:branched-chain amino acid transport system substrate-binding protein